MVQGCLLSLFGILDNLDYNIGTLFNTQNAGIQADVVILGLAPGAAGIVLIVYTAALILFCQTLLGCLFGFTVETNDTLSPVGNISEHVHVQCFGMILQDIVCIPANDDTGSLFSQLQNDIALYIPQKIGGGQTIHDTGNALWCKGIGEQTASGRMLTVLFHIFGSETGFQSNLINQFLVIEGDSKLIGNHVTDGTAATAKFATDGNNRLFHVGYLLISLTGNYPEIIISKEKRDVNDGVCPL